MKKKLLNFVLNFSLKCFFFQDLKILKKFLKKWKRVLKHSVVLDPIRRSLAETPSGHRSPSPFRLSPSSGSSIPAAPQSRSLSLSNAAVPESRIPARNEVSILASLIIAPNREAPMWMDVSLAFCRKQSSTVCPTFFPF